jgi:hypothetical protein
VLWPGFEPTTLWLRVRRPSHSAICLAWEFDFTHVSDQHTKLKRITSCIPCTYQPCLTTFVHNFIWILKLGNS